MIPDGRPLPAARTRRNPRRIGTAQQDVLLPHIERGVVRFIGATTHIPYFVNSPLVSRSQIFQLEPVDAEAIVSVLKRALAAEDRGLGGKNISAGDRCGKLS